MKVNLRRILMDLRRPDEDLVLLALSTLRRADLATDTTPVSELVALQTQLEALAAHPIVEVVTLAAELQKDLAENPLLLGAVEESTPDEPTREPAILPQQKELLGRPVADQVAALAEVRAAPSEAAREWILDLLGTPELPGGVLVHCLAILAERGRDGDVQVLRRYLAWPDGAVRAGAIAAISRRADPPEVFAALLPHLKDPSSEAREQALQALQALDSGMVQGALETMVRSESIAAKASSLYVLKHLEGDGALSLLGELAEDDSEEVRRRVAEAMEGRRGLAAEGLLERLLNDADIDVAERALEVLEGLFLEEGRDLGKWVAARSTSSTRPPPPQEIPPSAAPEPRGLSESPVAPATEAEPVAAPIPVPDPVSASPVEPEPTLTPPVEPHTAEATPAEPEPELAVAPDPDPEPEPPASKGDEKPVSSDERGTDPPRRPDPEVGSRGEEAPTALVSTDFGALEPGLQGVLEPMYQDLDQVLAAMGSKGFALYAGGRLRREELKDVADRVQRAQEDRDSVSGSGLLGMFMKADNRQEGLQALLEEAHRGFGERVIELYLDDQLRFVELDTHYRKVDALLEKARTAQN